MDVKSLFTNVSLKDAIDIALKKKYSQNEPPDLSRSTTKRLLYTAVSTVHFKCNDKWYVQKDGLTMAAVDQGWIDHVDVLLKRHVDF